MKHEGLSLMDQKLFTLQQILNHIIEDSGFFGSLVASQEGLIILTSNQMDPKIEIESLAAKAAAIFNEDGIISDNPEDIVISYPNRKIFIQRISLFDSIINSILLITIMPNNLRYFRRKVNKIAKQVCSIIS